MNQNIDKSVVTPFLFLGEEQKGSDYLERIECSKCGEKIYTKGVDLVTSGINCTNCGTFVEDFLSEDFGSVGLTSRERALSIVSVSNESNYTVEGIEVGEKFINFEVEQKRHKTRVSIPYNVITRRGTLLPGDFPYIEDINIAFDKVTSGSLKAFLIDLESKSKIFSDAIREYFYRDYD